MLRNFFAREELSGRYTEGQGLVEYALIILFVAVAAVGTLTIFGTTLGTTFGTINTNF